MPSYRVLFHSGGKACIGDRRCSRNLCKTARSQILRRAPLPQDCQHWFHQRYHTPHQTRKLRTRLVRISTSRTTSPAFQDVRSLFTTLLLGTPLLRYWNSFRTLRKFWQEMGKCSGQSSRQRCSPFRSTPPPVSLQSPSRQLPDKTQQHMLYVRFHVPDSFSSMPV